MPITRRLIGGLALKTEGSFFAFRLATTATTPKCQLRQRAYKNPYFTDRDRGK